MFEDYHELVVFVIYHRFSGVNTVILGLVFRACDHNRCVTVKHELDVVFLVTDQDFSVATSSSKEGSIKCVFVLSRVLKELDFVLLKYFALLVVSKYVCSTFLCSLN